MPLGLSQARRVDPEFRDISDEELQLILDELYALGRLSLEQWNKTHSPKFPLGILPSPIDSNKIKT